MQLKKWRNQKDEEDQREDQGEEDQQEEEEDWFGNKLSDQKPVKEIRGGG